MQRRLLIICAVCFALPSRIFAMCFEPPRPCTWYAFHHGQPSFIGTVVSEESVPDLLKLGNNELHVTVQKVIFKVEVVFDGRASKTEAVYGEGTTNDFRFKVGEKYLVYGWREKDGKIRTTRCTRTSLLREAKEDVEFLRSLPTQHEGKIFGTVRVMSPEPRPDAVLGTVSAFGPGGEHKTRVSASGSYELTGLVPGDYRETLILDKSPGEYVNSKVHIPINGSCAESGFVIP